MGDSDKNDDPPSDEETNSESDAEEGQSGVDRYWPPPITESCKIKVSYTSKTTSALAFNAAGSRLAAGSHDHSVKVWDFEVLDAQQPQSICDTQPCGQTVIKNLDYSNDDELILVISGSCQAVVMSKDGLVSKQHECPKGDQYISDMSRTKGHVQMLNDGCWNPKDKNLFMTSSNDATIRIWDINKLSQQTTVIKTRSQVSGLKAVPSVCKYTRDSLSLVAGCTDGSIMMWDTRRKFISTSNCIKNAHFKGDEITSIDFGYGLNKFCTRSQDETCKLWDLRQLKQPLATRGSLQTLYSNVDCSFSPDDKLVITGTSKSGKDPGQLLFLDAQDLTTKSSIDLPEVSVIRAKWHPKINHIAYSCSDGSMFIVYDAHRSIGGLLVGDSSRGTKRKKYVSQYSQAVSNSISIKKIITPHSLPLFRDDQPSSSFAKIRQDPKRSYKPEMPVAGANQGGRVKPAGSTLSSYIARNIAKPADDEGMDIRERILRHAEEAERDPHWVKPVAGATNSAPASGAQLKGQQPKQ